MILEWYKKNLILLPNKDNWWESKAAFNPAVLYDGNKVHMLYRAIGEYDQYISRLGYAYSTDGLKREKNKLHLNPLKSMKNMEQKIRG